MALQVNEFLFIHIFLHNIVLIFLFITKKILFQVEMGRIGLHLWTSFSIRTCDALSGLMWPSRPDTDPVPYNGLETSLRRFYSPALPENLSTLTVAERVKFKTVTTLTTPIRTY
jgi:hypothetical protein